MAYGLYWELSSISLLQTIIQLYYRPHWPHSRCRRQSGPQLRSCPTSLQSETNLWSHPWCSTFLRSESQPFRILFLWHLLGPKGNSPPWSRNGEDCLWGILHRRCLHGHRRRQRRSMLATSRAFGAQAWRCSELSTLGPRCSCGQDLDLYSQHMHEQFHYVYYCILLAHGLEWWLWCLELRQGRQLLTDPHGPLNLCPPQSRS